MIIKTAPAKINLSLHVTGKRPNGYHELSSVVVFTNKGDEISLSESSSYKLTSSGPFATKLPEPSENLISKAALKAAEFFKQDLHVHFHLIKNLPIASGIGGGTSNAATALHLLIAYWKVDQKKEGFSDLLLSLGADMPVCFYQSPCLMYGIGESLIPFDIPFSLPLLLVNPLKHIATPDVFRARNAPFNAACPLPKAQDIASFIHELVPLQNDLEPPAIFLCPEIKDILDELKQQEGCKISRMSGSGATCFGLFESQEDLRHAETNLKTRFPNYWVAIL